MSAKRTPKSRRAISDKAWVVAGLAAFLAIDILLVALALGWGRDEAQAGAWEAPSQTSSQTQDDSENTLEDLPSSAEPEQAQAAPRLLSVVSETVAWRSEGGACEERGEIELTVDGGETWGSAYPAAEGLGRPLWLSGADYAAVQASIASESGCELIGVRTHDSGATWSQEDQVAENSVLIDPSDASVLIWGGDPIDGPCAAMTQAAVTGGIASAVCDDGSIWSLESDKTEWAENGVYGAIAVSGSNGRWIAAVDSTDCDGVGLVAFGDETVQQLSCTSIRPGEATALDLEGNTVWLWAGDQVSVSTDFGRSLSS